MLKALERQFPMFDPVVRLAELAEMSREDLLERKAEHEAFIADGTLPAGHGADDPPPQRITATETNMVSCMYERCAKFLVPVLKASEMKVDGDLTSEVTVRFLREGEAKGDG